MEKIKPPKARPINPRNVPRIFTEKPHWLNGRHRFRLSEEGVGDQLVSTKGKVKTFREGQTDDGQIQNERTLKREEDEMSFLGLAIRGEGKGG